MNKHHKECLRLLSTLESHITSEQYYNALTVNTVLQKYLLWALAGEMPVEACKVPKYAVVCNCGGTPYIDGTDSKKTQVRCPRCRKGVSAPTKRDAIEDWNNAIYAFNANKLFPKRCSCGSTPICDTQTGTLGFIVRCPECGKSMSASSIEIAIESWNDTMEDYIEPVKEECGNCKFWHMLRNVLKLKSDWCGDFRYKKGI